MRRSDDRSRESRSSRDYVDEERSRDLERKRREWRIEQEKRREHEKRKQKMIEEWEAKRARELELKKQRRRSKSPSRSASPGPSRRRRSRSVESRRSRVASKVPVMSEKCDSSSTANTPFFKGSEGSKISVSELKKIKVNIQREISNAEETPELLRDITSPDEIVLKRREGLSLEATRLGGNVALNVSVGFTREGAKPIFEREELKANDSSGDEVRERRTIVAVDEIETDKRRSSKRCRSVSSERSRSRSSRRPSRQTYPEDGSTRRKVVQPALSQRIKKYRINILSEGSKPIFEREELKTEKSNTVDIPERRTVVALDKIETDKHRSSIRRSRSLSPERRTRCSSRQASTYEQASQSHGGSCQKSYERESNDRYHARRHDSHDVTSHRSASRDRNARSRSYRDSGAINHREGFGDYSNSRRHGDDMMNNRRALPLPYSQPIPFPIYYDNLVRPMMVDPMMMMRIPRGRAPPMMSTLRPPYRPRFLPPDMYQLNTPPNQKYGRMF